MTFDKKNLLFYLLKFMGFFCLAYFGTLAVIGLSAPGNYYSSAIDHYFNYVSWLRSSLLYGSKWCLSLFGFDAYLTSPYFLKLKGGFGVRIVYSCIGYGVMSFWLAFILANKGSIQKKLIWVTSGLVLIFLINILRICFLILAVNRVWPGFSGFNHHTWFNAAAYVLIFLLMYFFDKSSRVKPSALNTNLFNIGS